LGGASIAIRGDQRTQARVLHVLPVAANANDPLFSAAAVLVVTSRTASIAPSGPLLEQLYDLSPTEARIARALAGGASLREIADRSKT
jgi:DNA-binding NarL/FixJ family response regulator